MWKYFEVVTDLRDISTDETVNKDKLTPIPDNYQQYALSDMSRVLGLDWNEAYHIATYVATEKFYQTPNWDDADIIYVKLYTEELTPIRLFYCWVDTVTENDMVRLQISSPIELSNARERIEKALGITKARKKAERRANKRRLYANG